jgi:two-component system, NarL family, response regulator NreC
MERYRIVIADDHALLRQGLRRIIEGVGDLEVAGEAGDGMELLELLAESSIDLVILDLSMPKLHGLEAMRRIRGKYPEVRLLVLTMHKEFLHEALSAGASGCLVKEDADRELFSALERIRQGGVYVSPRLRDDGTVRAHATGEALSHREREVLQLIVEGKSNRDVADILLLSVRTVEAHRAAIQHKLSLGNTAELVRYAFEVGYLS